MGLWGERFSRCCNIIWLRELVLGLLDTLTINEYYLSIATAFDMENHGSKDYKLLGGSNYDISA